MLLPLSHAEDFGDFLGWVTHMEVSATKALSWCIGRRCEDGGGEGALSPATGAPRDPLLHEATAVPLIGIKSL